MNPNHDRELQAALLKLDSYSADECMRLRSRLLVVRIWCYAGWLTVALIMAVVCSR